MGDKEACGVAVVGAGRWGINLVRSFHRLGVLRTVCDADPTVLRACKERYSSIQLTSSFEEVLKDGKIGATVIAVPAGQHFTLAQEALRAGKHVFVEKPLALDVVQGRTLVSLADQRQLTLMVGHVLRYHPAIVKLKELLESGALGRIYYAYSSRLNLGTFRQEENILWSFAPHDISVLMHLLGESPISVAAHGAAYLQANIDDVTLSTLEFRSGVRAHIFVSWLHPYKEHRLVVVGSKQMAVFDGTARGRELCLYEPKIEWINRVPVAKEVSPRPVSVSDGEPLLRECQEFLASIREKRSPRTDGQEGVRVLEVLDALQRSLEKGGRHIHWGHEPSKDYYVHPSAVVDEPCDIGPGTKIWHCSHIMEGARIGKDCNFGQNVFVASDTVIGDNVKIQNNVSVYSGVVLEDDVFCGPSMVFTNVSTPRSHFPRRDKYERTLVQRGATLGANCTIVCGVTIGQYAFLAAGAVVTRDVPNHALVAGVPARQVGWMCQCGQRLAVDGSEIVCPLCGHAYELQEGRLIDATGSH